MSYDLSIEAGPGKKLDRKSFAAYFRSRPNFQVKNGQALYQNEETGVYFIFDEPEEGVVMFNLNYFRPHVFGLEAAIELERLGKALNARFGDPQGGMNGAFSRDAFLRGWNYGNRFAVRSMLAEQGPVHSWPGKRIRQVWEWNYARGVERQMDEDVIFAPTIFAVDVNGDALSVAIWPPECAILLPEVDAVMVPLAQTGPQSQEMSLVIWDEVLPVVKAYQEKKPGIVQYRLDFEDWPREVAAFLAKRRRATGKLNGIGMDEILDRELVEEKD